MFFFAVQNIIACQEQRTPSPIEESKRNIYVIDEIVFERREERGTWGFDIDRHASDATDEVGCYHEDMVDPLGNQGIDNAISGLVPALELTEAAAIEPLIDEAIRNGNLVLVLEHTEQGVFMYKGIGAPMVGTDGRLLDGQSFVVEPEPLQEVMLVEEGHTWVGTPFALQIGLSIMGNDIDFDMSQGGIRLQENEDGSIRGTFGGAIPLSSLLVIADDEQVGPNELFRNLIESAADLFPDEQGQCQYFSMAFSFHGIPAFFIE